MRISISSLALVIGLLAGCSLGESPLGDEWLATRSEVLLSEEPDNAMGILEFRESGSSQGDIVLLGRIGGVKDPWSPGKAAFVMSDPVADIGADHVCDGCAFCKKKKENRINPSAIVRITDAQGSVLPVDARKLLDLNESQTVIVRGRATVDSIGNLVLSAKGIYIRR